MNIIQKLDSGKIVLFYIISLKNIAAAAVVFMLIFDYI